MKKLEIGQAVRLKEDVLKEDVLANYPWIVCCTDGKIVKQSEVWGEHGLTWAVEFDDGSTGWFYPCDLEIVETESPYEEGDEDELDDLLERAAAVADEHAESRIGQ